MIEKLHQAIKELELNEGGSIYSRTFDETNLNWCKDGDEYNFIWLKAMLYYANDLLMHNGFIYINDVYELLGFERVEEFKYVGWVYDTEDCEHYGDNYVSFGLELEELFRNRKEKLDDSDRILLDFNVDGYIGPRKKIDYDIPNE